MVGIKKALAFVCPYRCRPGATERPGSGGWGGGRRRPGTGGRMTTIGTMATVAATAVPGMVRSWQVPAASVPVGECASKPAPASHFLAGHGCGRRGRGAGAGDPRVQPDRRSRRGDPGAGGHVQIPALRGACPAQGARAGGESRAARGLRVAPSSRLTTAPREDAADWRAKHAPTPCLLRIPPRPGGCCCSSQR